MKTNFGDYFVDLAAPDYQDRIVEGLENDGLVTFDKMYDVEQFSDYAGQFGSIRKHRDADENGVTRIAVSETFHGGASLLGFSSQELTFHSDGTSTAQPPNLITLFCSKPAQQGGASIFLDGRELYELLSEQSPQAVEKLSMPKSAIFGSPDRPFVGSIFSRQPSGEVVIRFRYDDLGYFSAPTLSVLPEILEIMRARCVTIHLQEHQGYILKNGRWLHGRTEFKGEREMFRILIDTNPESPVGSKIGWGFAPRLLQ